MANPQDQIPEHKHKFTAKPEFLGAGCLCGVSRFGTVFGLAVYDPKTRKTTRVSDKKVLYEEQAS